MLNAPMIKTGGECHGELAVKGTPVSLSAAEPPSVPPMSVTWIDKLAIENLVEGDADEIARLRAMHAETMNGLYAEPAAARLRVLARTISVLRAKVMILEGLSDRMLAARDLAAVAALQKTLDATTRRMTMLLAEHRLATQGDQRRVSVAVVGQAQVNVSGLR
jgi:hypothetical protein